MVLLSKNPLSTNNTVPARYACLTLAGLTLLLGIGCQKKHQVSSVKSIYVPNKLSSKYEINPLSIIRDDNVDEATRLRFGDVRESRDEFSYRMGLQRSEIIKFLSERFKKQFSYDENYQLATISESADRSSKLVRVAPYKSQYGMYILTRNLNSIPISDSNFFPRRVNIDGSMIGLKRILGAGSKKYEPFMLKSDGEYVPLEGLKKAILKQGIAIDNSKFTWVKFTYYKGEVIGGSLPRTDPDGADHPFIYNRLTGVLNILPTGNFDATSIMITGAGKLKDGRQIATGSFIDVDINTNNPGKLNVIWIDTENGFQPWIVGEVNEEIVDGFSNIWSFENSIGLDRNNNPIISAESSTLKDENGQILRHPADVILKARIVIEIATR